MRPIPVSAPSLGGNEKQYLEQCINTGWISSEGPFVERLEKEFARSVDREYGIAVCNGTAALELGLQMLGLQHGDEVIVPTFTIISCALAVLRAGAVPVFVDSDSLTWNMDPDAVAGIITENTKAVMLVHIYGLPAHVDKWLELARRHSLRVIEDASQMHGQNYHDSPCGSFGELSVFSFYPNKLVTTGEGGIVVTDDSDTAERCRLLRNLAFRPEKRFVHDELGWNFRMSNLQAAVGVAQLERLEEFVRRKRHIGSRYTENLSSLAGAQLPLDKTEYSRNIYWAYGVVLADEVGPDPEEVMRRLSEKQIGTRPFFWPMHEQPALVGRYRETGRGYPVAERLARRGFYLPSGVMLSDAEIDYVSSALIDILK